ncbi:MAG: metal ABC transporter substrate-binding protein [Chloroflexota bacterium]
MSRFARQPLIKALRGLAVVPLLLLAGCGGDPVAGQPTGTSSGGKIVVVATTTQIRSMAESVAGDRATVRSILTPGADAHEFEPRPSDVQAISVSAVVLKNGVGLDDWVDKLITNAGGDRPLVVVSKDIPIRAGDEEEPGGDPHVWFNASNAITMTRHIRDALVQVDPVNADTYEANADTYIAKLSDLDKYITAQIETIPADQRKMVTNHDAFGYFIDRYKLTFVGSIVPSMSSSAQPSAQDVADLIKMIKDENVKAIFLENSINPKLAEQVGRDAGVKVIDTLYGDSLGDVGTPGADYIGMMRFNTDTIVSGLK